MRSFKLQLAAFTAAATIACNDSLAPFQPEIANLPDNFQAQATGVQNVTSNLEYTWQNSGTTANVNQATVISGGAATLTVLDAQSVQVYTKDLGANGTFQTSAGTAGAWKVRVALVNFSGTLNFRLQKP